MRRIGAGTMSQLLITTKALLPQMRKLINLGNDLNRARDKFERENPSPVGKFSRENWEKYHKDEGINESKSAIINHLNEISHDELMIINAVMYIGRDERDPEELEGIDEFENYHELQEEAEQNGVFDSPQKKIFDYLRIVKGSKESKDITIDMMIEKSPFPEYMARGIKILNL
jgi:hypothetical protein